MDSFSYGYYIRGVREDAMGRCKNQWKSLGSGLVRNCQRLTALDLCGQVGLQTMLSKMQMLRKEQP